MKIICLKGGLGNQIFEYCRFRQLKEKATERVFLYYDRQKLKQHHNILISHCFSVTLPPQPWWVSSVVRIIKCMRTLHVLPRLYDDEREDCLLIDDYCQHKRFIIDAHEYLVFRDIALSSRYSQYKARILSSAHPVAIHIRRGDYLQKDNLESFGLCGKDYYQQAIRRITEGTEGQKDFFIFSDDMEWAKQNVTACNAVYIEHEAGTPDYADLYLMTLCRSHIIANSTFSFWGARLSRHSSEGVCIYPKAWYRNPSWTAPDIFPSQWIALFSPNQAE